MPASSVVWGSATARTTVRTTHPLVVLVVVVVSALNNGTSFPLARALSRYRELAADRAAAVLTGQLSVLAAALTKL